MLKLCCFLLIFFCSIKVQSQQSYISIEGKIVSGLGSPASWTTLKIKRGRFNFMGTSCDVNGVFHFDGAKINDTVFLSCIGQKPEYFVLDKAYRYLEINMQTDTFKTIFSSNRYRLNNKYHAPLQVSIAGGNMVETQKEVRYAEPEKERIFTMVEVEPMLNSVSVTKFFDTLRTEIQKLPRRFRKKDATVKIFFDIEQLGVVKMHNIASDCNDKMKTLIGQLFETTIKGIFGIQNGRHATAFCFVDFTISTKDKTTFITLNSP